MNTDGCFRTVGFYAGRNNLDFGIRPGDKVLDIGAGPNPFPYATHILDTDDAAFNKQRHGQGVKALQNQIFIKGTTDRLFEMKDKEFDFIYTSHLLEHVENLPQVLEEMSRVGKRGFNAVPHCLYDAWSSAVHYGHKWFCDYDYVNNIFLIKRRTAEDYVDRGPKIWEEVMDGRNRHWLFFFEGHDCAGMRMFWEVRFFWRDKIEYRIDNTILPQLELYKEMVRQKKKSGVQVLY